MAQANTLRPMKTSSPARGNSPFQATKLVCQNWLRPNSCHVFLVQYNIMKDGIVEIPNKIIIIRHKSFSDESVVKLPK